MSYQSSFSAAQIVLYSPILKESPAVRTSYIAYLKKMTKRARFDRKKYVQAELAFYRQHLCKDLMHPERCRSLPPHISALIPLDLACLLGFQSHYLDFSNQVRTLADKFDRDFDASRGRSSYFMLALQAATSGNPALWAKVLSGIDKLNTDYLNFFLLVRRNAEFVNRDPLRVLVTATMSAGKSTLINGLVGKKVNLTRNLVCTSKTHIILSKPYEDGYTTEYDKDIVFDADSNTLLTDNDENPSNRITVSTCFQSGLKGERLLLMDTPGINSSENEAHSQITQQVVQKGQYDVILYVLNATQLRTMDDEVHLKFIANHSGDKPVFFVLNKTDQLLAEEDDLIGLVQRQQLYLESLGFSEPMIFPISAKAVSLAQKALREPLGRIERREFENLSDAFNQMNFCAWYEKLLQGNIYIPWDSSEAKNLLRNCGFAYLEKFLAELSRNYAGSK